MKNILMLVIGALIGGACVFGYFNYSINRASTAQIDSELTIFNNKISDLDKEIAKYKSGLLPSLLKTQKAIYAEIVASLEAKKAQFAHWISLDYPVSLSATIPAGDVKGYEEEIAKLEKGIEADKQESAKYKPCLVKSLIDTRIAQNQLTQAGLERAKIAKKYNLPILSIPGDKEPTPAEAPLVQTPEQDKESL